MTWLEPAINTNSTSASKSSLEEKGHVEPRLELNAVCTFGEIEGESGLVSSKIVDMEDEFIRQVFLVPPDDPTNSSINKPILVPTHINTLYKGQPKVPLKIRVNEWGNKPSTRSINMNRSVPSV